MISKDNLKDLYPLSPMQEGMLFQTLMAPERDIYHEQVVYYLNGVIDPGRMEQAWKSLFVRHDILRTVFISEKVKRPLQAVLHQHCGPFCYFDESTGNSRQRNTGQAISFDDQTIQKIVKQHQQEDLADRFDLLRTPLMRMRLLKLADQQYALIWSMHHIIMDGWCTPLLLNDFLSAYYGQNQSRPTGLPYNQYIQWLEQQEPSQAKSFWQVRLAPVTQPAKIPFQPFQKGTNRPLATDAAPIDAMQTTQSETVAITGTQKLKTRCVMSREHYTHVKTISRQWQVTENAVIQAGWALLLAHYNNQSDKDSIPEQTQSIVFGTLVSGRPQHLSGIENTLGVFINTIPMVVSIDDQSTFVDLCRQVQSWLLESADSQYLPLSEIQSCSPLGNHLINHVFAFENFPRLDNHAEVAHGDGFEVKKTEKVEDVPYDFALVVSPDILTDQQALTENSTLAFEFLFNQKQFPEDLGHRIFSHLTTLLDSMGNIVQLDQVPAMGIDYVPEAEIALITEFNDTKRPVPEVTSFIALFEKAALEQPDAIALIDEHVTWTYQDLNHQASRLARILIDEMGVQKGDHIGLSVNQGHRYILAVLAIAKCNAVFIPSDPGYPGKRQVQTFEQASCRYVFVGQLSEQMTEQLSESQGDTLRYVDFSVLQTRAMGNQQHIEYSDTRTSTESSVNDLAYIIYTSGSTGTPKGVMIEQQGLINLIRWSQNAFELKPGCKITLFASTAFDASIWETLPGLCCGATLVKFPRTIRTDSRAIAAFIEKQQIDVAFVPPALCSELVTLYSPQVINCTLLSGGDVLGNLGAMLSDVRVINNYGPSEFSVVATSGVLHSEDQYPYSIGRPIDNTEILILDRHHRTLPIGVPGEVALSGLSLGRGYFGNDTQTGQRFIA
ncbi:MAG: condensation domain-containing protein, partial [Pseudomonadales bacterium]|nr:condensation domain-containing protein [Pseudomonadales bacterium]